MAAKPLTKTKLIGYFAEKLQVTRKASATFFAELAQLTSSEVKKSGSFLLPGIGKVVKAHRKARVGRNPKTGEPIKIAAKTVLRIRPVKALKDSVLTKK